MNLVKKSRKLTNFDRTFEEKMCVIFRCCFGIGVGWIARFGVIGVKYHSSSDRTGDFRQTSTIFQVFVVISRP